MTSCSRTRDRSSRTSDTVRCCCCLLLSPLRHSSIDLLVCLFAGGRYNADVSVCAPDETGAVGFYGQANPDPDGTTSAPGVFMETGVPSNCSAVSGGR